MGEILIDLVDNGITAEDFYSNKSSNRIYE